MSKSEKNRPLDGNEEKSEAIASQDGPVWRPRCSDTKKEGREEKKGKKKRETKNRVSKLFATRSARQALVMVAGEKGAV